MDKVGGTLSYVNQEENITDIDYNAFRTIAEAFPFMPVKFPDGTWADNRLYPNAEGQFNPVHYLEDRRYIMNTQNCSEAFIPTSLLQKTWRCAPLSAPIS